MHQARAHLSCQRNEPEDTRGRLTMTSGGTDMVEWIISLASHKSVVDIEPEVTL